MRLGWMPGSYVLPAGFQAEQWSIADLRAVLRGRNQALAFAALQELGRRGSAGADALLAEVQAERVWPREVAAAIAFQFGSRVEARRRRPPPGWPRRAHPPLPPLSRLVR